MESFRLNCMKLFIPKKHDHRTEFKEEFTVRYLGSGQLERPGLEEMCSFVEATTHNRRKSKERKLQKRNLTISEQDFSITLSLADSITSPLVFKIRRIQFCAVYQLNPKIFFFTYQFGKTADTVDCHVVMCKSKKQAKILAKEASVLFKDATFSLHKQLHLESREVLTQMVAPASVKTRSNNDYKLKQDL